MKPSEVVHLERVDTKRFIELLKEARKSLRGSEGIDQTPSRELETT